MNELEIPFRKLYNKLLLTTITKNQFIIVIMLN